MLWSIDKVRAEPSQDRAGPQQTDLTRKQNYNSKTVDDLTIALVPLETWLEEKLTWTLKRKKQHIKKWLKIPTRRRKIWRRKLGIEKIKYDATSSKRRRNISKWVGFFDIERL